MRQVGFAYAQARMQARRAAGPAPIDWQLIETGRSYVQCLDAAKRTALADHLGHLGPETDARTVEATLIESWAEEVAAIAAWMPPDWRASLVWLTPLPHLAMIAGGTAPPALPGAGLSGNVDDIAAAWEQGLATRIPPRQEALIRALAPLTDRFLICAPRAAAETSALIAQFERQLRAAAQTPLAAFSYLGLLALDFERLRGALISALLLPVSVREEAA